MDGQILVILFLLFSVISSVFKKLRERNEPDETKLQRKHPSHQVGRRNDPFEEEDVDLSEWEILLGAPTKPEKRPEPVYEEFREVRGKRTVDESDTGPEFEEVHGKRSVSEAPTGPEFKPVQAKRPIQESLAYNENDPTAQVSRLQSTPVPKKRKKRKQLLNFSRKTVRQAIVYNEIIGPPRAENMPF